MAINYADKYSNKVDERFTLASITDAAVNNDYDFVGVNAVNIYSIPTVALNDYSMTGTNRYGTPEELQDTKQTLTLSQDKSFTYTIDRRNESDSAGAKDAGSALRREIDEVIIPTIDKYRITALATGAGTTSAATVITKENAYSEFLDGQAVLHENNVPLTGRIAYVSPSFYKFIKQDSAFVLASDMAQEAKINGSLGMVDGVQIVIAPASYLPANRDFIITYYNALVSPVKLAEYKTHPDAPGIDGTLVEGRIYYDAFVLANKASSIYVHKNA